jgi:hypothetical protein
MKMKAFTTIAFGLFLIISPKESCAKQFNVDGFTVEVLWKVRGEKLIVWGDVEGGESCSQVNLHIYFANRKMSGGASIETNTPRNHSPGDRSPFQGEDDIYSRDNKLDWFVDGIHLDCL